MYIFYYIFLAIAGIHYIGEMNKKTGVSKILMDQLTNGQLQWVDLDDEFDIVSFAHFFLLMCGVHLPAVIVSLIFTNIENNLSTNDCYR